MKISHSSRPETSNHTHLQLAFSGIRIKWFYHALMGSINMFWDEGSFIGKAQGFSEICQLEY